MSLRRNFLDHVCSIKEWVHLYLLEHSRKYIPNAPIYYMDPNP